MDFVEILTMMFGGTSVFTLIELIRFRKQDRRNRESDAKIRELDAHNADTEAQSRQIDLANKYSENMLSMMDRMQSIKEGQEKGNDNQSKMIEMLNSIDKRTDNVEIKVGDMEMYLNGNYHAFLAEKSRKKNSKNSKNKENEKIG